MDKFRIKEIKNKLNLTVRYRIQKRFLLFFWTAYGEDVGMLHVESRVFTSKEDAECYLEEVKEFESNP